MAQSVKNLPANAGDTRDANSIPWSGVSSGGGNGNLLQYSCLGNSMNRGVLLATSPMIPESDSTEDSQIFIDQDSLAKNHVFLIIIPMPALPLIVNCCLIPAC